VSGRSPRRVPSEIFTSRTGDIGRRLLNNVRSPTPQRSERRVTDIARPRTRVRARRRCTVPRHRTRAHNVRLRRGPGAPYRQLGVGCAYDDGRQASGHLPSSEDVDRSKRTPVWRATPVRRPRSRVRHGGTSALLSSRVLSCLRAAVDGSTSPDLWLMQDEVSRDRLFGGTRRAFNLVVTGLQQLRRHIRVVPGRARLEVRPDRPDREVDPTAGYLCHRSESCGYR